MHIQLDSNYTLSTDRFNFILSEYRKQGENTKEPGKVFESPLAYSGNLQDILQSYRKTAVLRSNATTLDELRDILNEIDENIKTVGAKLKL